MKKKIIITILLSFLLIISSQSIAKTNNKNSINNNLVKKTNQQIYLGYSSILGNGNSSTLTAELENDIIIRLNSTNGVVDFYIDYEMNCYGLTDEGIITLTIFLNDENVSFNFVQTGLLIDSKNGTLSVSDVPVERGDALTFRINVAYGSVIPLYSNSTSATGFGVVSKYRSISNNIFQDSLINSLEIINILLRRFLH